eukprot:4462506-Prymnesium_polylepis.1
MASTAPQWADAPDGSTQLAPYLRLLLNRHELCVPTAQAASGTHRTPATHADSTLSSHYKQVAYYKAYSSTSAVVEHAIVSDRPSRVRRRDADSHYGADRASDASLHWCGTLALRICRKVEHICPIVRGAVILQHIVPIVAGIPQMPTCQHTLAKGCSQGAAEALSRWGRGNEDLRGR